jgi:hypothetical protein
MSNKKENNLLEFHETTDYLMEQMDKMMNEYVDINSITELQESCAGAGKLIDYLKKYTKTITAYDIEKRTDRDDITICDYLKEKIEYKNRRLTFINPPFHLGIKFIYKALEEGDWCVALISKSSIMNIDYDRYDVEQIWIYNKQDFGTCKADVCILIIKNK